MTVNYNKLWKKLIDLNMSKTQLREKSGITTNALAKKGKNEMFQQKCFARFVKLCNVKLKT